MSVFVVQADNILLGDFSAELIRACQHQNWYSDSSNHTIYLESHGSVQIVGDSRIQSLTDIKYRRIDFTPVGSLEYVQSHMRGKTIKPINIPKELCTKHFTQRETYRFESIKEAVREVKCFEGNKLFVKSDTRCKTNATGVYTISEMAKLQELAQDKIFITSPIEIRSEWRAFVFNGKILDARQYQGYWQDQFDPEFVTEAVTAFKKCPPAYTLDFGLTEDRKMIVIEAHNFISCGLYGFNDARYLPQMFTSAYKYENNKK